MQIANDYICDIAGPNNEFTDGRVYIDNGC